MADNGCFNISTPWNLGIELAVSKYELGLLCKNTIRSSSNSRLYWLYTSYTSGNDEALHNKSYVTESDGRSFMLHSVFLHCPLATCGYKTLDMLLVQIEICCRCKIFTRFQRWWFSRSIMSNSCDPMDCSLPGSSVHGISQARILEWVAIPFSMGSALPGIQPSLLHCR